MRTTVDLIRRHPEAGLPGGMGSVLGTRWGKETSGVSSPRSSGRQYCESGSYLWTSTSVLLIRLI